MVSLLSVQDLWKSFGALRASDGIDLEVADGETHAVIGPNGAGKTTFISQLAGTLRPDGGRISFAGEDITHMTAARRARRGLARSFQITSVFPNFTALQNVALAVQARSGRTGFWRDARTDALLLDPAHSVLEQIGFEKTRFNILAASLSHGEQRQLEVAMARASNPALMLLDEPASGLSRGDRTALTDLLLTLDPAITLILIEHDMDVALRVADRVTMMHDGRVIVEGTPDEIRANQTVHDLYLGRHGGE